MLGLMTEIRWAVDNSKFHCGKVSLRVMKTLWVYCQTIYCNTRTATYLCYRQRPITRPSALLNWLHTSVLSQQSSSMLQIPKSCEQAAHTPVLPASDWGMHLLQVSIPEHSDRPLILPALSIEQVMPHVGAGVWLVVVVLVVVLVVVVVVVVVVVGVIVI